MKTQVIAKLGQLHITALEASRVQKSRDYRMLTSTWIVAPWDLPRPEPRKRAS